MEVTRIFDLTDRYLALFKDKEVAIAGKTDGKWYHYSTLEYIQLVNYFSYGLLEIGIKKGDKIATIFSNNRPEWNIFDLGMQQAGIIHVPVYPTISDEDQEYILNHCEAKLCLVSDQAAYKKIYPIIQKSNLIKDLYTLNELDGVKNWREIIELGKSNQMKYENIILETRKDISPNDLATIIYTSGTTGSPKGVMLSHSNLVSNFISTSKLMPLESQHKALSILPLCHVYERMINYNFQYKGISIYYAENLGTIPSDLKYVQPYAFTTVPRILERFYDKIIATGKDLGSIKKTIFFWALKLGLRYKIRNGNGWFYNQKLKIARKLVFSKWKKAMGNNIIIIVSGGAALQPRLERIFWAAGIPILEGYGLTETSPVIAVNHFDENNLMFGTVGPILENVEVKINEDGEILCKGPNVMLGYYKEDENTKQLIDREGWFHTGDIGRMEENKYLKITDRKKEIFKTSAGKYIAPQMIENKLKESDLIEQVMVVGESEKFVSALISPNFNYLHYYASKHKLHFRDNNELIQKPEIQKRYQKEIALFNKQLGQIEQIKRFKLVCEDWTPTTGELSPTLKLKRGVIYKRYNHLLREIYSYQKGEINRADKEQV